MKLVVLESVRLDFPFQLGVLVKETTAMVLYNRLNHDPELDETYRVTLKNVHAIVDYSELYKLEQIQKEFSAKYWALEDERKQHINNLRG